MRWVFAALLLVVVVGCGGGDDDGGGVGSVCSTPGSTSGCASGNICTNLAGGSNQCRQVCTVQADCPAGQNCNGIANTTIKSCQP
jgi:hypothetical protein